MTPAMLAEKTNERYVREWLHANAAAGYVTYDASKDTFTLPPEQSFALGTENGPASIAGAFAVIQALWMNIPKMVDNFKERRGARSRSSRPSLRTAPSTMLWGGFHRFRRATQTPFNLVLEPRP